MAASGRAHENAAHADHRRWQGGDAIPEPHDSPRRRTFDEPHPRVDAGSLRGRPAAGSAKQTPGAREKARLGERRVGDWGSCSPCRAEGARNTAQRDADPREGSSWLPSIENVPRRGPTRPSGRASRKTQRSGGISTPRVCSIEARSARAPGPGAWPSPARRRVTRARSDSGSIGVRRSDHSLFQPALRWEPSQ